MAGLLQPNQPEEAKAELVDFLVRVVADRQGAGGAAIPTPSATNARTGLRP